MISDKERQIQESLANKDYREALAVEHVNTTLAIQIRKMRENQQWKQSDLAEHLGKHQETMSQWEDPDYGRHSMTTLKALAAIFDVALLVKFIPFSELVKDMINLSETRLAPPSYNEEQSQLATDMLSRASEVKSAVGIDANNGLSSLVVSQINNIQAGSFFDDTPGTTNELKKELLNNA